MENYLLLNKSKELVELSEKLGFTKTLFLGTDFVIINGKTKNELLKNVKTAQKKKLITIFIPESEEMLRFALEKSAVDIVMGAELINPKDSVHFVRGGLDQVTCKIAAENGKIIGFSFSGILNSKERGKLLARMKLNIKLCKKYKVKMIFSNFSSEKMEMRSFQDVKKFHSLMS